MKRIWAFLAVAIFGFSNFSYASESDKLPSKLKLVPLVKTASNSASPELKEEFTVLQFWASWCVGCGDTMKLITSWNKKKSELGYLSISVDDSVSEAKTYFDGKNKSLKPLMSKAYLDKSGTLAQKLGLKGVPTILLVNQSGQIVYSIFGHPSAKDFEKMDSIISKKST